ncbi:MAG: M48 family metalloprotease [Pelagibacterales bacterium]|nr:M48 family metalloprotease [Pelagibacterales bacterium]
MINSYIFILKVLFIASIFLSIGSCVKNNATGERQLVILSEAEENNIGAKEHPKIIKNFGGIYQNKKLQEYIRNIGNKIIAKSGIPNTRWTFTILDSPIVNAFALPGGYVYVTRGLLALANDEAEIASVIGHEIAHVTARHTAQRHAKSTLSGIGLDLLSIVVGQPIITNLASIGVQGVLSSFSRSEELEADELGIQYIFKAKYDPEGSYRFLSRLDKLTKISSNNEQNAINSIFATHPKTIDRMKISKENIPSNVSYKNYRKKYLSIINNMVYGDNASQGIIKNNQFFHLELDFSFNIPKKYKVSNNDNSIILFTKTKEEIIIFDGLDSQPGMSLIELAESIYNRSDIKAFKEIDINDKLAIYFDEKPIIKYEGREYNRRTYLINWDNGRVWRFSILINPLNKGMNFKNGNLVVLSLHNLTEEERVIGKPKYIKIIETKLNDTPTILSTQMGIEDKKLEYFCIINGINLDNSNEILEQGTLIKMIVN